MTQDNAVEWCEHALEDAYEWLRSIPCPNNTPDTSLHSIVQHTKPPVKAHKFASTSENFVSSNANPYNNILSEPLHSPYQQQPPDAKDLLPAPTEDDFLHKLMNSKESEVHTSSHSDVPLILAACGGVACPVASASEAENSVFSAATSAEQSEPNVASDTINEQEATLSTSPPETLNLRPDNDQDVFPTIEEQLQPEHPEGALLSPLEGHMHNSFPEDLPLQPEHPEEAVSAIPTYDFQCSPEQIKKEPQQYTPKLRQGPFMQLLVKILGW
jgi:hypothetical protein